MFCRPSRRRGSIRARDRGDAAISARSLLRLSAAASGRRSPVPRPPSSRRWTNHRPRRLPPPPPSRVHPVEQCIGKEGLARLQARYAELLTRISDQVTEPGQRDARRAEAAALDPDSWVTAGEAVTGIEGFETRVSELRAKLGRRRRSRRGGRRRGGPARSPAPEGTAATAEQGGPDSPSTTVTKPGFEPSESE